jgi:hypothetical protein
MTGYAQLSRVLMELSHEPYAAAQNEAYQCTLRRAGMMAKLFLTARFDFRGVRNWLLA